MNKIFQLLLVLSLSAVLPVSAYERGKTVDINGSKVIIKNANLSATILPERAGRITSLYLNGKQLELLTPCKVTAVEETPLFSYSTDNMMGIYELIWGQKINGTVSMKCTAKADNALLEGKFYGNIELDLQREITLVPDTFEMLIKCVITNTAKTPQKIAPWIHLVGTPVSTAIIPQSAGPVRRTGFGSVGKSPVPSLATFGKHNNYLPPGADWAAVKFAEKSVVWVIRLPEGTLDKEGVFYSWGDGKVNGIQTTEVVWPAKMIAPMEKLSVSYSIAVFDGLDSVNTVFGSTGAEFALKDGKLVLKFCASAGENARKAVLTCKDKAGTETQYAFDIPALKAGKCAEVTLPAKELPYTAKIKIDGKKEYTVFF